MTKREIEQTILDNEKLIFFVIYRYFPDQHDDEDIIQAGRIGLWNACVKYDSSKSRFSTFAVQCIINAIRMELRRRARQLGPGDVISLDEPLRHDEGRGAAALLDLVPDPDSGYLEVDYDISFLRGMLSKREFEMFRLSVLGFTAEEIGQMFGCTRAWAHQVIKKARAAARKQMFPA